MVAVKAGDVVDVSLLIVVIIDSSFSVDFTLQRT